MDKSQIAEALQDLGFKVEDVAEHGLIFEYEGLKYLCNPEDEDDDFFRLSAPCIYQVEDEENRPVVLEIANEVNCLFKYTKTMLVEDYIWVSYEAKIFPGVEVEELVRYAIIIVHASVEMFYRKLSGGEDPAASNNENE